MFVQKRVLQNLIDVDILEETDTDFKSRIYHYIQREGKSINFKVVEERNKNRRAYFVIHLEIDGKFIAAGEGYNKKMAEQSAAMKALTDLKIDTEEA